MINSHRLAFNFDPALLKADVDQISTGVWVAHFNVGYYEGEWSGVALRSVGGVATQLYPAPNPAESYADTATLSRCPNLRQVLARFQCELRSVRLLKLSAGSVIKEHRDYDLAYEDGEIRIHIPVVTNPGVEFFLDGERVELNEGECWYLNLNLPHRVINNGETDRIHLVIDCVVNEWLRRELAPVDESGGRASEPVAEPISSPEELERFRQAVLGNIDLQSRLREVANSQTFIRLLTELGLEQGYRFAPVDVQEALISARRAWFERWIQ